MFAFAEVVAGVVGVGVVGGGVSLCVVFYCI